MGNQSVHPFGPEIAAKTVALAGAVAGGVVMSILDPAMGIPATIITTGNGIRSIKKTIDNDRIYEVPDNNKYRGTDNLYIYQNAQYNLRLTPERLLDPFDGLKLVRVYTCCHADLLYDAIESKYMEQKQITHRPAERYWTLFNVNCVMLFISMCDVILTL